MASLTNLGRRAQGVDSWNVFRSAEKVEPDFIGWDLSEQDISGFDLGGAQSRLPRRRIEQSVTGRGSAVLFLPGNLVSYGRFEKKGLDRQSQASSSHPDSLIQINPELPINQLIWTPMNADRLKAVSSARYVG